LLFFLGRLLHDIGSRSEVQERLRQELATELGEGEMSLARRLPYLTACLYETLRTTSSAIVPHMANRDTSIAGVFIPTVY
jgi:cytochrome P450